MALATVAVSPASEAVRAVGVELRLSFSYRDSLLGMVAVDATIIRRSHVSHVAPPRPATACRNDSAARSSDSCDE